MWLKGKTIERVSSRIGVGVVETGEGDDQKTINIKNHPIQSSPVQSGPVRPNFQGISL